MDVYNDKNSCEVFQNLSEFYWVEDLKKLVIEELYDFEQAYILCSYHFGFAKSDFEKQLIKSQQFNSLKEELADSLKTRIKAIYGNKENDMYKRLQINHEKEIKEFLSLYKDWRQ